ncbi:MAG TPA: hypothetical protein VJO32_16795 [Ktedonobacteraceae bacterium]|nr:hypothetical protein [Ktedonobacteraceae bacterium]
MISNNVKEEHMLHTSMEMPRRRPLGVSILAVLEGLQGVGFLIMGLLALVAVIVAASSSGTTTVEGFTITGAVVSVVAGVLAGVFLLLGFLSFLFTWGLWTLRRWAFWATVIIEVISLANSVVALTQANANIGVIVGGMIFPIVILLYFLVDSNVRAAFRV